MEQLSYKQWFQSGQYFEHRGHRIFYQTGGSGGNGPALLLIHGFPTASWDWHHQWPALCEEFSLVIAADMIGFGYSAKPRRYDYSILDQADLYETLLKQLAVRRYHVLAHDYGDTVAQELLARHNEGRGAADLLSVCFLNGGLFPETHHPRPIQKLLAGPLGSLMTCLNSEHSFARSFSAVFGASTRPTAAEIREFWQMIDYNNGSRIFHKLIGYMAERRLRRERWVGALQNTRVPLRVIDGLVDPVSGAHMVARYRELVPHPDVIELPGIGHYPQVEAPEAVLKAFLDFHAHLAQNSHPS